MYCPVENSSSDDRSCMTRCCRLYGLALSFLGALVFFLLGMILAVTFADTIAASLPLFVAALIIILVVFVVTVLTRGCCNTRE